jgi:hypothetical protein
VHPREYPNSRYTYFWIRREGHLDGTWTRWPKSPFESTCDVHRWYVRLIYIPFPLPRKPPTVALFHQYLWETRFTQQQVVCLRRRSPLRQEKRSSEAGLCWAQGFHWGKQFALRCGCRTFTKVVLIQKLLGISICYGLFISRLLALMRNNVVLLTCSKDDTSGQEHS